MLDKATEELNTIIVTNTLFNMKDSEMRYIFSARKFFLLKDEKFEETIFEINVAVCSY